MNRDPTSTERVAGRHRILGESLRRRHAGAMTLADLRPTVPEHDVHRHQHDDMHLLLLLDGAYVSSARGMPEVCVEPVVVLNPPGTEHRDRFRTRDGRFVTLSVPAAEFEWITSASRISEQPQRLPAASLRIALGLLVELAQWDDAAPLAIEQILARLLDDAATRRDTEAPASIGLRRVSECLEAASGPPPTLAELAQIADLHPVYLARAFARRYGLSPSDYLRRHRVQRALPMIVRGRPLAEVALALGYADQSHLHRCFLREFGLTPGALRRLALARGEVARVQDALCRGR